jgi:integrase
LAEVQQAAGHANIATTSVYLHIAVDDDGEPEDLFGSGADKHNRGGLA